MSIAIDEALKYNIISQETSRFIASKCECGNDLVMSDSLRMLMCSDKYCVYNTISRVNKFVQKFNISISITDTEKIVKQLKIKTPYQLLLVPEAFNTNNDIVKNLNICNKDDFIQSVEKLKQKDYLIYEIVEMCGIESIVKIANKLFKGFDNIDEIYKEIEVAQVTFINERLGIDNQDSSIISLDIFNKLLDIKDELIFAESIFKIKERDKHRLNIAFCNVPTRFLNLGELLEWLNNRYEVEFNLVTVIGDNTDILVRGIENNSSKYRSAKMINDRNIADLMNSSKLEFKDIGKMSETEFKPLGHKIYIDTLDNIINRLDSFKVESDGK